MPYQMTNDIKGKILNLKGKGYIFSRKDCSINKFFENSHFFVLKKILGEANGGTKKICKLKVK